jgi:hypothetical protein
LRHSFGTLAVQAFPLSDVQAWMGHRDIQTTMRYVHHVPKTDAAQRLGLLLDAENVAPNLAPSSRRHGSGSGVDLDETDAHVFTIREGRIARWQNFNARADALKAAGLSE